MDDADVTPGDTDPGDVQPDRPDAPVDGEPDGAEDVPPDGLDVAPDGEDDGLGEEGAADAMPDDGGEEEADSADSVEDGVIDVPPDGPRDADGDTYPEGVDCNDVDPYVYPGTARACSNACGSGTQTCMPDASWTACDAPTDCLCTPPASRVGPCGACGTGPQTCSLEGVWVAAGPCVGEGECYPGSLNTEPYEEFYERRRTCTETCSWGDWGDLVLVTPCTTGAETITIVGCPQGQNRRVRCDAAGTWTVADPCTDACLHARRLSGYSEELCVPGGAFMMGHDTYAADTNPAHWVLLSPFLMDKYEVTNARYRECVAAGRCTAPRAVDGVSYYLTPIESYATYPVDGVSFAQAEEFCAWDGGRRLPTEAEFEKAARGTSPTAYYPWPDTTPLCDAVNGRACDEGLYPIEVDARPAGASAYGIIGLHGNAAERTADFYQTDYYSVSPMFDPRGPSSGSYRVSRGASSGTARPYPPVWRRAMTSTAASGSAGMGFRCVRSAGPR